VDGRPYGDSSPETGLWEVMTRVQDGIAGDLEADSLFTIPRINQ
jgi:hypothetical protein